MNVIAFENGACGKAQRYLDAYIGGELTTESAQEIVAHLDGCGNCQGEMETRVRLRTAVRAAARSSEAAPEYLRTRIGAQLRAEQSRSRWGLAMPGWAVPVAAALGVVALGGGLLWNSALLRRGEAPVDLRALTYERQEPVISRLLAGVPQFLRTGLGNHLHCAVARVTWPTESELQPHQKLDGGWIPLPAMVRKLMPEKFVLRTSHRCIYHGKKYVHLAFESEGRLISLSILRKAEAGVVTPESILSPAATAGYQVTAFDSNEYVVYLSSDLDAHGNVQLARSLSEPVREFLNALKS